MEFGKFLLSEQDWSPEEIEELFSDKYTDAYVSNAIRPIGIHVTHITPPAQGWPIALYCSICRETTFVLSPWAKRPEDGDYWKIISCAIYSEHNMKMAMKVYDSSTNGCKNIQELDAAIKDMQNAGKDDPPVVIPYPWPD